MSGEAFYVPVNGPPEMLGVLARALLRAPGHRLALLPAGEATLEEVGPLQGGADTARERLPQRLAAQDQANEAWSAHLAAAQTLVPKGDVLIREARLYDPRDLTVTAGTSVLVRDAHIARDPARIEQALGIAPRAAN